MMSSDSEGCCVPLRVESASNNVRCEAQDEKYGVFYVCRKLAVTVFSFDSHQTFYCESHASMYYEHCLCRECGVFCVQGELCSCRSSKIHHWTHLRCFQKRNYLCSHCGSSVNISFIRQLLPLNSRLLQKLSSLSLSNNIQPSPHNFVLLCDEGVQTWLPHFLCDTSNDCKDITLPDRAVLSIEESHIDLLRTIRLHLSEGDVTQLDLDALLTRAVLEHNTVGVLLILHIISGKIEPNILRLAVMTDDCLSLKALLHKFIPPTSEDMALLGSLLHSALIHSKFSTVRELLKFRSSCANILLGNGDSLLQVAIKLGLVEGVQTLLEYGSNPKLVNSLGETSLHTLCTYAIENRLEIARTILAKGHCDEITLNKANKNGKSPLEVACAEGLWEIALLLLEHGAVPCNLCEELNPPSSLKSSMETSLKRIRLKRKFSVGRHCIMSDVSMGRENIAVPVFNDLMDGAVIDVEFSYSPSFENLSNLLHHEMNTRDENFVMVADLSLGCHCDENCGLNCPCASSNVYTAHGSLSSEAVEFAAQGALETIVECCSSCRCSQRCGNRIAQRGLKAKLEIFRTRDRGWGVRTSSLLRKGEFICEYVGEVISSEEECNRDDDSYFFEITDTFLSFTVDSKFCGNVSRFINHSCQANIVMARVVWDTNSVHVPHLCLFALHDISAGEELTFDYGDRWWKVKSKIQCKCGSARCRYLRLDLPCDSRRK